jgi:ribosomal protein S18 acetylase RimI-like enzyme
MIRAARPEDLSQLTDLLTSSFYQRSGWIIWIYTLGKLGIQEDLKQRIKSQKPNYVCLTAISTRDQAVVVPGTVSHQSAISLPDSVAGTLELSERQSWPWQALSPKYIYLSNLAVRADLRRRGIAQALLDHAETLAQAWHFKDIYLHVMEDNVEARKLYRKAGFSLFQAEDSPYSWLGLQPRRLLLYKSLPQASRTNSIRR